MMKVRMFMVAVALAGAIPIQTKGHPAEAPETVVVRSGGANTSWPTLASNRAWSVSGRSV